MTTSFKVSTVLANLPHPYPEHQVLSDTLSRSSPRDREVIANLWLSEGLPFIFRECPVVFEEIRKWLGKKLYVHPKEVTLIGSARTGYSLVTCKSGKSFGADSDLDLSVISEHLYEKLVKDFNCFKEDFEDSVIHPENNSERRYWLENIKFGRRNIPRGFLDANKIPNKYPTAKNINYSVSHLLEKIRNTEVAPQIPRASVRVYQNWNKFIDQMVLNLESVMNGRQARQ